MKYLIALPDNIQFAWQILVQINNFKKLGLESDLNFVIGYRNNIVSNLMKEIEASSSANFYYYPDTREGVKYTSTLRPHILKKFFKQYPNTDRWFYLDPDVILSKEIDFTSMTGDTWYLSDTRSYLDSLYIKSKGEELFLVMCSISKIHHDTVINNDLNAGGAQYLLNGTNENFWFEVEKASERLYNYMEKTITIFTPEHPIQSWTADMWAILWASWNDNNVSKIVPELDFAWATDPITKLDNVSILHNAGVTNQTDLFYKGLYTTTAPFTDNLSHVSDQFCSYKYVEEIEDTKINYPTLITKF